MSANFVHKEKSGLAGKSVEIKKGSLAGQVYRVEDWWDRLGSGSWMWAKGNPAALVYAVRSAKERLPTDDEVLYGKIGAFGHLVHVSEIGEEVE